LKNLLQIALRGGVCMNILAINGSPRGKNSNTDQLLIPFLKGAQEGGAIVEELYLSQKNIKGCQGCFACWVKTPGKCVLKDDMPELLDKVNAADVLIFGTPLYACGF
jgi:multimeric flavodoxin WrbA